MKRIQTPPDFTLGGLALWVHGWEFEDANNADDADWLRITARQASSGSTVMVDGPVFRATDLARFLSSLEHLEDTMFGEAVLEGLEPNLKVTVRSMPRGAVELIVRITPDPLGEKHSFRSEIDSSYLPEAISRLKSLLVRFSPCDR